MIAPRSPHQGGLWESAVKAGKSLLMKSIGTQILSLMELSTILCKIEAILNSRPLSYRVTNEFVEPVTPGHFLVGSALLETPVLDNGSVTLKQRYMLWRRIVDSFWVSWRHDYLNQLQQRGKWKERMENVSKGDVVLVSSPNDSVMNWPMGRIIDVFPDKKGIVRNVSVRLGNGTVRRTSVQKLVALPVDVSKDD
ncbi:uncharacterized protein LOC135836763 [Planococcus citri]|uniref:uncharacterized protein LOC135836763 n=1 Tax=Planococcus citri TaxID=170843 RepID=UPI0031F885D7